MLQQLSLNASAPAASVHWDHLPGLYALTDGAGRITAVNAGLLKALALQPEHVVGQSLDVLLPGPGRILLQTHIWPLLHRTGAATEIYLQLKAADGTRLPCLLNAQRHIGPEVQGVAWSFFVVQERSRFEAALLAMRRNAESLAESLAQREAFLSVLTNALPGMVAHWDHNLRCTFANAAHEAVSGRPVESLLGMSLPDLLGLERMADFAPKLALLLAGEAQQSELSIHGPGEQERHWQLELVPERDAKGQVSGFFVLGSDVTSLRQASLDQRMAASVLRSTLDGILIADHEGHILSANPAFCKLTGSDEQALIGQPAPFARPRTADGQADEVWHALETRGQWRGEYWSERAHGEQHLLAQSVTAIRNEDPRAAVQTQRYVAVYSDITERWRQDERVRQLALYDSLTGLPNRHLMTERLAQLVIRASREHSSVMLMFLDLDGFKAVNDSLGHSAGDQLLQQVAGRLLQQVRETDTVARLGGDEFVVLLDNPNSMEEALNVAQRILAALSVPFELQVESTDAKVRPPSVAHIGASIGLASLGPSCLTAEQLLARADAAMYAAKAAGKGRVHLAPG